MTRPISCLKCKKPLGEIRDARILKGIAYLCDGCAERVMNPPTYKKPVGNIFDEIFKGSGKR